ncbi:transglycosylase SLT domain-containing protein [Saccharicrinis sp. FJH54]|uniref:lytic transglycosylase domain-containing protein n=1 Tax=Saccharicrinis sp. FJH54 TaxID=3344665 RepID=UPI0035D4D28D
MRILITTIFLSIFMVIQPGFDMLGSGNRSESSPVNAMALLEKNRDQIYPANIEYLDKRTPVKLEYSRDVKKYIDFYILDNPEMLSIIAGRSEYYYPIFDDVLARHNLPLELKNLSVVESALNPFAVSRSGATGLWQFLFHTSRMFHLNIDSYVDERRDPVKSTEAACEFLSYLYRIFNDWQLAITAYNCGPGMIEKAIEKADGSTNYWDIRQYLSAEARDYYPKFVAACYITSFHDNHGIKSSKFEYNYDEVETVEVKQSIWYKQISKVIGVNETDLRMLNPVYKQDYIPVYENAVKINLPKRAVKPFILNEDKIYAYQLQAKDYNDLRAEAGGIEGKYKTIHFVQRGEYFHQIAMNSNCTLYDIMKWNNMEDKNLKAGQALVVYKENEKLNKNVPKLKKADKLPALLVDNQ